MCMAQRNVPVSVFSGMIALMHWRNEKVIYNFEPRIASEVMEQTDTPDRIFPLSCLHQLPYLFFRPRITKIKLETGLEERRATVNAVPIFIIFGLNRRTVSLQMIS